MRNSWLFSTWSCPQNALRARGWFVDVWRITLWDDRWIHSLSRFRRRNNVQEDCAPGYDVAEEHRLSGEGLDLKNPCDRPYHADKHQRYQVTSFLWKHRLGKSGETWVRSAFHSRPVRTNRHILSLCKACDQRRLDKWIHDKHRGEAFGAVLAFRKFI